LVTSFSLPPRAWAKVCAVHIRLVRPAGMQSAAYGAILPAYALGRKLRVWPMDRHGSLQGGRRGLGQATHCPACHRAQASPRCQNRGGPRVGSASIT
jgi:hypothetical protein